MKILHVALGATIWPAMCLLLLFVIDYSSGNLEANWEFRYGIIFLITSLIGFMRDLYDFNTEKSDLPVRNHKSDGL